MIELDIQNKQKHQAVVFKSTFDSYYEKHKNNKCI